MTRAHPVLGSRPKPPITRRASANARPAFTIIEATISTVIVAIMLVAALTTVGASKTTQHRVALVSRGQLLAETLMAEILQQNYQELAETPVFGRETGELATTRSAYDDVDDYIGWSACPPTAKDGTALTNATDWKRTVTVDRVDPLDPSKTATTETGAKRITVTALYRDVPQAKLTAVRTNGCPSIGSDVVPDG